MSGTETELSTAPLARSSEQEMWPLAPFVVAVLLLGGVAVGAVVFDISIAEYMRDPSRTAGLSPLVGALSHVGVLLWCATAAVCLFVGGATHRHASTPRQVTWFLVHFGLLSLVLMLDDLFLVHEELALRGIDEKLVYFLYGGVALWGLVRFRAVVYGTHVALLAAGAGFLAISTAIDMFQGTVATVVGGWRIFFEDGCKLLGIVGWFAYFQSCCMRTVDRLTDLKN